MTDHPATLEQREAEVLELRQGLDLYAASSVDTATLRAEKVALVNEVETYTLKFAQACEQQTTTSEVQAVDGRTADNSEHLPPHAAHVVDMDPVFNRPSRRRFLRLAGLSLILVPLHAACASAPGWPKAGRHDCAGYGQ